MTVLAFACLTAGGQTKSIRLRDGTVATPPRPAITSPQSTSRLSPSTASGLYLIQFESPATPDERAQLRAMGVRLLKYIPDDAFIARLDNVSPARVQALDFVRWMGAYDSGYNIAPSLSTLAGKAKIPGTVTNVTVLISPGAMAAEINGVKSIFSRIQHESDLRMGTVLRGELNL